MSKPKKHELVIPTLHEGAFATAMDPGNLFVADKRLSRKVNAKFHALMEKRRVLFRCDAIDALHDLAMMPVSDNALLNQVKYMAAKTLYGEQEAPLSGMGEIEGTLKQLNDAYHSAAPRIKSVRERVITFEQEPALIEP